MLEEWRLHDTLTHSFIIFKVIIFKYTYFFFVDDCNLYTKHQIFIIINLLITGSRYIWNQKIKNKNKKR